MSNSLLDFISNISYSVNGNFFFTAAQPKSLQSQLIPPFMSHLTINLPANFIWNAFKIYPESNHFLLTTLVIPILSHLDNYNYPSNCLSASIHVSFQTTGFLWKQVASCLCSDSPNYSQMRGIIMFSRPYNLENNPAPLQPSWKNLH
jgi:hypothetical protein